MKIFTEILEASDSTERDDTVKASVFIKSSKFSTSELVQYLNGWYLVDTFSRIGTSWGEIFSKLDKEAIVTEFNSHSLPTSSFLLR